MDTMEWIRQQDGDLLADIEDWFRTEGKAFMPKLIKMKVTTVVSIPMEDELIHVLPDRPFCQDMTCGCHEDQELIKEFLTEPWIQGHLTEKEAEQLFQG